VDTGHTRFGAEGTPGSLRPLSVRLDCGLHDHVCPCPSTLLSDEGAPALLTGERILVRDRRPRYMFALWSGRGGGYSSIMLIDGCNVF